MNTYQEWEDSLDRNYIEQLDPSAFELAPCAYEAGAQSKQAKIDELRKRIDEAIAVADADSGVSIPAFVKLNKILKGTTNEQ